MEKKKLNFPKNDKGEEYWIPIVIKNSDCLVGFLEAFKSFCSFYDIPSATDVNVMISSDRFNDILPDGSRHRHLSRDELKEKLLGMIKADEERLEHSDNDEGILDGNLLNLDCPHCGMFYPFKNSLLIPKEDFDCNVCGNKLIFYIKEDAYNFDYDGNENVIDSIMQEITDELGL